MGVRYVTGDPDVVAGVGVAPLQTVPSFDEHLMTSRKDQEVLEIVVAVQGHRTPGGITAASHRYGSRRPRPS